MGKFIKIFILAAAASAAFNLPVLAQSGGACLQCEYAGLLNQTKKIIELSEFSRNFEDRIFLEIKIQENTARLKEIKNEIRRQSQASLPNLKDVRNAFSFLNLPDAALSKTEFILENKEYIKALSEFLDLLDYAAREGAGSAPLGYMTGAQFKDAVKGRTPFDYYMSKNPFVLQKYHRETYILENAVVGVLVNSDKADAIILSIINGKYNIHYIEIDDTSLVEREWELRDNPRNFVSKNVLRDTVLPCDITDVMRNHFLTISKARRR